MIEVLLFDFDGVVRHFDRSRVPIIERAAGLPLGSIASVAFSDEQLIPAITGRIRDEVWRERIAAALTSAYPESDARSAVREWSQSIGTIDAEMEALVAECRGRYRIGLVSNATSRLASDLALLNVAQHFDEIINSSEVGIAKPDRGIYDHAIARMQRAAGQMLFVDDAPQNVEAARSLGITAIHHTSPAETRQAMHELGVL